MVNSANRIKGCSVKLRARDCLYGADILVGIGAILCSIPVLLYAFIPDMVTHSVLLAILNLSYSFLAAAIFYVLQVIIPRIIRMKRAVDALSKSIVSLYQSLALADSLLSIFIDVGDNETVRIPYVDNGFIYYYVSNGDHKIKEYKNFMAYLETMPTDIKNKLRNIHETSFYNDLPLVLTVLLENLELENFSAIRAIGDMYPNSERYSSISRDLAVLKEYCNKLAKFMVNVEETKIIPLTDEERKKYLDELEWFSEILNSFKNAAYRRAHVRSRKSPLDK